MINIESRREMFLDDYLIESMSGAQLTLQKPERREVAFSMDAEWEDFVAFPDSIVKWENGWVMHYRAGIMDLKDEENTVIMALAESEDGITFNRPELGLCEFKGSKKNNILQIGGFPNVPPAFIDANPACSPGQRFKGINFHKATAYAMCSADGLHWSLMQESPLKLPGQFDSVNTAFWDTVSGCYRSYTRSWHDLKTGRVLEGWNFENAQPVRAIQHAVSPDFIHWSAPEQLRYSDGDMSVHLYTNAIVPCPGAEHIYVGFPNRFVPERKPDPTHEHDGVNDALFMSSRDGVNWTRRLDAWVYPGLDDLNWTQRNNYPAWGIAETSATEWSMYITEHYMRKNTPTRIRRLYIRPWGFVSVHAPYASGEMVTRPFTFTGSELRINARTSAQGYIGVEIQDENSHPIPGYTMDDMTLWYGDGLDVAVTWKNESALSRLSNKSVRLRFSMKDADLFGIRFV